MRRELGKSLLTVALSLLLAAAGLADTPTPVPTPKTPKPKTLQDGLAGLWADEAETRRKAAECLGALGDRAAVEPLLAALTGRYAVRSRVRIVPAASARGLSQAAELPRRYGYHAGRLGSDAFLREVLSHRRAAEWSWVRRQNATVSPTSLLGTLRSSLRCRRVGGVDFEVTLVGADAASLPPMLSMLMSMYAKDSRTRSEQRDRRADLDARLPVVEAAALADQKEWADFQASGDLQRAKTVYDQQKKKAQPLVDDLDSAEDDLEDARKDRDRRKEALEDERDTEDQIARDRNRTQRRLADAIARRDPNKPDPALEREILLLQNKLDALEDQLDDARRDVRDARDDLDKAERKVDDAEEEIARLKRRIERLVATARDLVNRLEQTFNQLAARVEASRTRLAILQRELAALPPMAELAPADAYANPIRRPATAAAIARSADERKALIGALGRLADARAVPALIDLLKAADTPLHTPAAAALKQITGQDLGTDPAKWQAWLTRQRPQP